MTTLTSPITNAKPSDLVFVSQTNELVTDSRHVAQYFGKRHDNVIRSIKGLDCSQKFNRLNFEGVHYHDAKGEIRQAYQMTKNGFMFLVMGFTGKRAAEIKERYIQAFDEMAEQLSKQPTMPTIDATIADFPIGTRCLLRVDETGTHLSPIDINGKGLADIRAIRAIQRDAMLLSQALDEMKHRMMALSGEFSLDKLDKPLLQ
ncbi:Rha family transcriptional regulator [Shewanella chilikensis]|uniref:Rha family transcriptional regulator n=1 Tax=Shewanella chilikensis TaxID=558541 RepID=UPI00200D3458|nr:Rha family transcriptional regulator [Shewanella chilikensis]MCL1161451.1 Rha family transcriptional regulator [Shewanella chilikensis]